MRIAKGENVFIYSVREALDLAEGIALECDIAGAKPVVVTYSDEYMRESLIQPSEGFVEASSPIWLKALEASDAYIALGIPALAAVPVPKIGAWRRSRKAVSDILDKKGIRWVGIRYPTPNRAREQGMTLSKFRKIILSSLDIDYRELVKKGRKIVDAVSASETIRVESGKGTDLEFKVIDRKWIIDDGVISAEDVEAGDVGLNLPCGEVFVSPIENSANGPIFFDVPTNYWGHKITGLKLEFKEGRVVRYEAEQGEREFGQVLEAATGDKDRIAEFAIGLNPKAEFINDILVDEKVLGSIHLAIGNNKGPAYGGKNDSSIHWDLVATHSTVTADGKVIMKNGKLQI